MPVKIHLLLHPDLQSEWSGFASSTHESMTGREEQNSISRKHQTSRQQSIRIQIKHLSEALDATVPTPRIRHQSENGIMQVRRFSGGIARCAYIANGLAFSYNRKPVCVVVLQVRVVMAVLFGAQNNQRFAAHAQPAFPNHQSACGGQHLAAFRRKNVNAFVYAGFSSRVIPERLAVPVFARGVFNRNHEFFGQGKAQQNSTRKNSQTPPFPRIPVRNIVS